MSDKLYTEADLRAAFREGWKARNRVPGLNKPIVRPARDGTDRMVQRSVYCCVAGHGGEGDSFRLEDWQAAMGIDWMAKSEIVEAIPPAYTRFIGEQLIRHLRGERIAA